MLDYAQYALTAGTDTRAVVCSHCPFGGLPGHGDALGRVILEVRDGEDTRGRAGNRPYAT